jgi:UTP--glucose-1-phosphate uridylyltransferase
MMRIRKAVIPAAGLGTRLYPMTRAQPKEMLPVLDKPVIHYVVEEAVNSGLDEILVIVGRGKEAIINYFDKSSMDDKVKDDYGLSSFPNILFVRQKEQLGFADAVRCARSFVGDDPFVVLAGDTIYRSGRKETVTSQLTSVLVKRHEPVIGLEKVPKELIRNYGIIDGSKEDGRIWKIRDMVEKPDPGDAPSNMGAIGLYALTPDIFDFIDRIKPGKNCEYQLTDALRLLAKEKTLLGYEIEGKRYDIGTKELWVSTFMEFARSDPRFGRR